VQISRRLARQNEVGFVLESGLRLVTRHCCHKYGGK